jgi:hypothetical protein
MQSGAVTGTVAFEEKFLALAPPPAAPQNPQLPPGVVPGQPPQQQPPGQVPPRQPRPRVVVPPPTPPQAQPQQLQQAQPAQNNQRPGRRGGR